MGKMTYQNGMRDRHGVMSHIGWGGEQITIYKGVETFPTSIGGKKECQREHWAPKGGGL